MTTTQPTTSEISQDLSVCKSEIFLGECKASDLIALLKNVEVDKDAMVSDAKAYGCPSNREVCIFSDDDNYFSVNFILHTDHAGSMHESENNWYANTSDTAFITDVEFEGEITEDEKVAIENLLNEKYTF